MTYTKTVIKQQVRLHLPPTSRKPQAYMCLKASKPNPTRVARGHDIPEDREMRPNKRVAPTSRVSHLRAAFPKVSDVLLVSGGENVAPKVGCLRTDASAVQIGSMAKKLTNIDLGPELSHRTLSDSGFDDEKALSGVPGRMSEGTSDRTRPTPRVSRHVVDNPSRSLLRY